MIYFVFLPYQIKTIVARKAILECFGKVIYSFKFIIRHAFKNYRVVYFKEMI